MMVLMVMLSTITSIEHFLCEHKCSALIAIISLKLLKYNANILTKSRLRVNIRIIKFSSYLTIVQKYNALALRART